MRWTCPPPSPRDCLLLHRTHYCRCNGSWLPPFPPPSPLTVLCRGIFGRWPTQFTTAASAVVGTEAARLAVLLTQNAYLIAITHIFDRTLSRSIPCDLIAIKRWSRQALNCSYWWQVLHIWSGSGGSRKLIITCGTFAVVSHGIWQTGPRNLEKFAEEKCGP